MNFYLYQLLNTYSLIRNQKMAAEKYVTCLLGAMDTLWFHQIILSPQPSSFDIPKIPLPISENSSKNIPQMSQSSQIMVDESSSQESDHEDKKNTNVYIKTRPRSSSPLSAQNHSRNVRYSTTIMLQKSMSCKSLFELELEEVKGFMDLGFIFNKHNLSKRVTSLIPGLQRLDDEDEEKKGGINIARPYLSEAWIDELLCEPPLMDLRMPTRAYNAKDMKKHLRFWARSVASAIHQQA